MQNISQKIKNLEAQKQALDQKLFDLKKANVQKLASVLATIEDIEKVDAYFLIGAVLDTLKNPPQEKEALHKAGKMFYQKNKHQIITLNATQTTTNKNATKTAKG